jgi:hypothetical protein
MRTKEEILCECSNLSNTTIKRYSKSTLFTPEEAKKAMTEYARECCGEQVKLFYGDILRECPYIQINQLKEWVDLFKNQMPEGL